MAKLAPTKPPKAPAEKVKQPSEPKTLDPHEHNDPPKVEGKPEKEKRNLK